jgi:hypothetical protein
LPEGRDGGNNVVATVTTPALKARAQDKALKCVEPSNRWLQPQALRTNIVHGLLGYISRFGASANTRENRYRTELEGRRLRTIRLSSGRR